MLEIRRVEEKSLLFEIMQNQRVRFLDEFSGVRRVFRHVALSVHKLDERQVIPAAGF